MTGGTGAFGTAVCRELSRAGADPVAMARHEPRHLPAGVRFVAGDVRDPDALLRAVAGCETVVHLAWYMGVNASPADMAAINVAGTTNLLDAMDRTGCRRLVFSSSVTAYGPADSHPGPFREDEPLRPLPGFLYAVHKQQVEELIAGRDLDAVVARTTVVLGRAVDNDAAQAYGGLALVDIGGRSRVQAVHQEDVARFVRQATLGDWRGTVNLAAPGSVPMREAGRLLDRRVATVPLRAALSAVRLANRLGQDGIDGDVLRTMAAWPVADTTRLTEEWGFSLNWSQEEVLRDHARRASRCTWVMPGGRRLTRRRRLAWAATEPLAPTVLRPEVDWRPGAPDGVRGGFDTPIDPVYPVYSATNLSEAFPGPMTPLSLELALHGMGAAIDGLVTLFGLEGELADVLRLGIGSFAHQPYVNVSSARVMAEVMPGATVEDVDRMYLGTGTGAGIGAGGSGGQGRSRPQLSLREIPAAARLTGRVVPAMAGYRTEVDRLVDDVRRVAAVDTAALSDEQLISHLALVHDLVCQAWNTSSTGNFLLSGLQRSVEQDDGPSELTASAAMLHGVALLADELRRDTTAAAVLTSTSDRREALGRLRLEAPAFAARFDDLVTRVGHRGPGETELANDVFADRPELLLDVVTRAAEGAIRPKTAPAGSRRPDPAAVLGRRVLASKERARDVVVLAIHAFRRAARERAARLVAAGRLSQPDDVWYLTYEQLLADEPSPLGPLVAERRRERERLATYKMPLVVDGAWAPEATSDSTTPQPGERLQGIGAVPGQVTGRARVMRTPEDDLEPGDILVATTTDVGWTPYFALAAAVVTEVGGVASHAAIVAREYGIPAVLGVAGATTRLRTGVTVVVDGAAGTVEIVSAPAD